MPNRDPEIPPWLDIRVYLYDFMWMCVCVRLPCSQCVTYWLMCDPSHYLVQTCQLHLHWHHVESVSLEDLRRRFRSQEKSHNVNHRRRDDNTNAGTAFGTSKQIYDFKIVVKHVKHSKLFLWNFQLTFLCVCGYAYICMCVCVYVITRMRFFSWNRYCC